MNPRRLLEDKSLAELREIASTLDLQGYARMRKADLIDLLVEASTSADDDAEGDDSSDGGDEGDSAANEDDNAGGARPRQRRRGRSDGGADDDQADGGTGDGGKGDGGRDDGGRGGKNDGNGRKRPTYEAGEVREGVLDLLPEGYGFLRTSSYLTGKKDVYVSQSYVRRFQLRRGDRVRGPIRANNKGSDKFPAIAEVQEVEGIALDDHQEVERPDFDDLTAVPVTERVSLTPKDGSRTLALLDVVAPLGLGHRALVIGPRRSGRSALLSQVAAALADDTDLIYLMVDARPEDVTRARRAVPDVEIAAATFDRGAEDLVAVAELAIERARRLAERGRDVVVVVDDMTVLGRAYEQAGPSGRTGSDATLHGSTKRFFSAARRLEEGGSITIVAAATSGTSMTDDTHQAEVLLAGANVEWRLDGGLARRRVVPALDVVVSGSHHEADLLDGAALDATVVMRRALAGADLDRRAEVLLGLPEDADEAVVVKAFGSLG